jgi:hypothetical protein
MRFFSIIIFFIWVSLVVFGISLDKKVQNYDEVFFKKLILPTINRDKYQLGNLFSRQIGPKLPWQKTFEFNYHLYFSRQYWHQEVPVAELTYIEKKSIIDLSPPSIESLVYYFNNRKDKNNKNFFKDNNCLLTTLINQPFKEANLGILVVSKNLKKTNLCHRNLTLSLKDQFNDMTIDFEQKYKKIYEVAKNYSFIRGYVFIIQDALEKNYLGYKKDLLELDKFLDKTLSEKNKIVHKKEYKIFLLNHKFFIFFLFLPIYLLLIYIFIPNLTKEYLK